MLDAYAIALLSTYLEDAHDANPGDSLQMAESLLEMLESHGYNLIRSENANEHPESPSTSG